MTLDQTNKLVKTIKKDSDHYAPTKNVKTNEDFYKTPVQTMKHNYDENKYYTLNTGDKIPIVQFGTYKMKGEECYSGVLSAIQMGYKGLDTASIYANEGRNKYFP